MSSDIFVSKTALEEAGVKFTFGQCEYSGTPYTSASFPGYEYQREVGITLENKDEVHISCGGSFRSWLQQFLKDNSIEYQMF